jgi:hypothetical protein
MGYTQPWQYSERGSHEIHMSRPYVTRLHTWNNKYTPITHVCGDNINHRVQRQAHQNFGQHFSTWHTSRHPKNGEHVGSMGVYLEYTPYQYQYQT